MKLHPRKFDWRSILKKVKPEKIEDVMKVIKKDKQALRRRK